MTAAIVDAAPKGYYWGQPDSLIDWCELNYEHSPYIAEFYNTLSHVPAAAYMFVAMLIMALPRAIGTGRGKKWIPSLDWRHRISVLGIAVVCVGSVTFHATLRYWGQLLDEIPMLLVVGSFLYNLNRRIVWHTDSPVIRAEKLRFNRLLACAIIVFLIIDIVLYVVVKVYVMFVLSYIGGVTAIILQTIHLARKGAGVAPGSADAAKRRAYRRNLLWKALLAYAFAAVCWFTERLTCPHQPVALGHICRGENAPLFCHSLPYLHALWHVFSIVGSYAGCLFLALATTPDGSVGAVETERTVVWRYGFIVV